jgi:hypothetical protein
MIITPLTRTVIKLLEGGHYDQTPQLIAEAHVADLWYINEDGVQTRLRQVLVELGKVLPDVTVHPVAEPYFVREDTATE